MLSARDVAAATGGALTGPEEVAFTGVSTDTRRIDPGTLFVALRGERFDGHDFIPQALAAGATGLVVAADWPHAAPVSVVRVKDTLVAYGRIARAHRLALGLKVVAVTGSSGKTSTKELTAAYLSHFFAVSRTEANHNNEVGVPKTLLAAGPEHGVAVVEMGMRAPGEIGYLTEIAVPDVGVITNVGTAHIGRLGSRAAIAEAKAELWRHMPAHATAVYPREDALAREQFVRWGGRGLDVSLHDPEAAVWASEAQPHGTGQVFIARWHAHDGVAAGACEVKLPFWGDHHRLNALMALACGLALGEAPPARLSLAPEALTGRHALVDVAGVSVLDDSYNANPDSMKAALKAFAEGGGRTFAVLGDMGELGDYAESAHREVGAYASGLGLAGLYAVGELAGHYAAGYEGDRHFSEPSEAARALAPVLAPGDRVLVKASRSAKLERLVTELVSLLKSPTA